MALEVKNQPANAGDTKGVVTNLLVGRSPGGVVQSSECLCLEDPMDRESGRLSSPEGRSESDPAEGTEHASIFLRAAVIQMCSRLYGILLCKYHNVLNHSTGIDMLLF